VKIFGLDHPAKGDFMKRILAALVVVGLSAPAWAGPPATINGPAIYKKSCASCHGADAKGGTAPAIAGKPTSAIVAVVTSHPPPMNKIELTNDEIAAVARYASSLKK
jgi:mono/diheme cytochrome c family protein